MRSVVPVSTTWSPRERWLAVLNGERPDRTPTDIWATAEAMAALRRHTRTASARELYEKLHIDAVVTVAPRYVGPPLPPLTSEYGVRHRDVSHAGGVYREAVYHPLAEFDTVEELEVGYRWPSPDWYDYSDIPALAAEWSDYPIRGGGSEPLLRYIGLRGREQALMDLVENPELVHHCLDRLFAIAEANTLRIIEQIPGRVDLTYVAEDLGTQTELMYSPAHIEEYLFPRMRHIIELSHQAGAYVFHHDDGAVRAIVPGLIDLGIDLLNPIQWRCAGMEREALKRDFGGQITLHGGMDNQQTLAYGDEEAVRAEVRDNLAILGGGGGYVLAPCHNLQVVTPPEIVVAMYDEAYRVASG